jgi:DNA-directed RNA polymerase subunit H (RpoH/RPB5)
VSGLEPLKLIPKHELLSESAVKAVVKKLNTPMEKFPKILASDAQAKRLNAKPGNMIAISRHDPTGEYTYYRIVVPG